MSFTKKYREHHDDLLNIVNEILPYLDINTISNSAQEVRKLLSKFLGKLSIHLAMEDKSLYPNLLSHADEQVRSTAKKYIDEMGDIGIAVNSYKDQWSNPSKIQNDPATFIEQTNGIFNALAKRIERENNELYKIVDELELS
ncbi:MAG: hemerythrin domain-containing protein [Cytophagales bacterium]|nr:hemerythrin domain-containing protein [Cytophagales bacterium]